MSTAFLGDDVTCGPAPQLREHLGQSTWLGLFRGPPHALHLGRMPRPLTFHSGTASVAPQSEHFCFRVRCGFGFRFVLDINLSFLRM